MDRSTPILASDRRYLRALDAHGWDLEETARALGVKPVTVKKHLTRLRSLGFEPLSSEPFNFYPERSR